MNVRKVELVKKLETRKAELLKAITGEKEKTRKSREQWLTEQKAWAEKILAAKTPEDANKIKAARNYYPDGEYEVRQHVAALRDVESALAELGMIVEENIPVSSTRNYLKLVL